MTQTTDDGRFYAQYAARNCVCAYCWGTLAERWDEDEKRWIAVCSNNQDHIGYHHAAFKVREINDHSIKVAEVTDYYRRTEFAKEFGLTPPLTGEALQSQFRKYRSALGRDDSGL